jgi:hypothetical protein
MIAGIALLVLVLGFGALTLRLFVFPDLNAPEASNAIAVLGGASPAPPLEGVALAREGYARNLVISLNPSQQCETFVHLVPRAKVLCFRPDPATTQGEGREIGRLADEHHWRRVIVVMPTTQATRARLRIGRCYPGQVLEVGVPPQGLWGWTKGVLYEWGALIKALLLQPTC